MRFIQAWLATALIASVNGYWLMAAENLITTERMDPIVSPGVVSGHVHSVMGGSNFRLSTDTASLRKSECTSMPIAEDKSAYWFPHLYFQWKNGSVTSLNGGPVIYYLFDDKAGTTKEFPDDFRMISGNPTLRTYDANNYGQQAITFLCLDFDGVTTRHNELPAKKCPSGVRAQVNFPSCWDGKNTDSPDHKSHVAFLSGGPDSGTCSDPKFPVTLPRIFIEVYWSTGDVEQYRSQAANTSQPFVFAYGDPTGYGYHADFINGWDKGVLQNAVDKCHCDPNGSLECCANAGVFTYKKTPAKCHITKSIDEQTTGTLPKLPGNNPVQPYGKTATMYSDPNTPGLISPVYAYMGDTPSKTGSVVVPPSHGSTAPAASSATPAPASSKPISTPAEVSTSLATSTVVATSIKPSSPASTHVTSAQASTSHIFIHTSAASSSHVGTSTHVSAPHATTTSSPSHDTGSNPNGDEDDEDCDDEDDEPAGDDDDEECDDEDDEPTTPAPAQNHPSSSQGSPKPQQNNNNNGSNNHPSTPSTPSNSSPHNGGSPSLTDNPSTPQCGIRKFRHQWLRDQKAAKEAEAKKLAEALENPQKRSTHLSAHRVHHDRSKRLVTGY